MVDILEFMVDITFNPILTGPFLALFVQSHVAARIFFPKLIFVG